MPEKICGDCSYFMCGIPKESVSAYIEHVTKSRGPGAADEELKRIQHLPKPNGGRRFCSAQSCFAAPSDSCVCSTEYKPES